MLQTFVTRLAERCPANWMKCCQSGHETGIVWCHFRDKHQYLWRLRDPIDSNKRKGYFWAGDTLWADILMTSVLVSVAGCTCSWHLCLFGFFGSCPTCWCHKLPSPTNWALTFYRPGHPDKWASNGPFLYWPEANGSSLFLTTQKCAFTQLQWTCLVSKWASQTCVCLHAVVVGVE